MSWFAFDIDRYDADTMHLSAAEDGVYSRLLRFYYKTRMSLPDDDVALANIARVTIAEWEGMSATIRKFFRKRGGRLVNKRAEGELNEQEQRGAFKSPRRATSAQKRWNADYLAITGPDGNRLKRSERLSAAREKGTHTPAEWKAMVAIFASTCVKCGVAGNVVKDHVTPIYQGGSDAIDNLQPMCASCNSGKGPDTTDYRVTVCSDWNERLQKRLRETPPNASVRLQTPATLQDITRQDSPPKPPRLRGEVVDPDFETWYASYPHKVGRGAALRAYVRASRKATAEQLVAGVARYIATKPPDRSWCNPATWLNEERWNDQPDLIAGMTNGKPALGLLHYTEPWEQRVRGFRRSGLWDASWGKKPGEDGCRVPPGMLGP